MSDEKWHPVELVIMAFGEYMYIIRLVHTLQFRSNVHINA